MTEMSARLMASRCLPGRLGGATVGAAILVGVVIGCRPGATPSGVVVVATTPDGGAPTASPASPASPATGGGPSPTIAGRDAPPDALLAAEGGDPIAGQLGTYLWFDTGSDAPWLTGAPLAVGAGEPLTVDLEPDGDIAAWAARYSPAAATGPDGAASLAEGAGSPAFAAPGRGTWTLELFVEFAAGAGNARYFWHLQVE
jgi:hypothetical protein